MGSGRYHSITLMRKYFSVEIHKYLAVALVDQDTLPWTFSELTGIPVFNGSRTSLANIIKKPGLDQVKIIIDGMTERNIMPQSFDDPATEFTPLKHNNSSLFEIVTKTSPVRFSPYYLLPRSLLRVISDLNLISKGMCNPEYSFLSHRMLEDQLLSTISAIKKRSIIYNNLGYRYIFLPIPATQTLYDKSINHFTRDFLTVLSKELTKNSIEHINLLPAFLDNMGDSLYNKYDTHWNKNGTHLAAQIIANHLNNNPTEEIK